MAEVIANSEAAVPAKSLRRSRQRAVAVALLGAGTLLQSARSIAQQNGPPSSGSTAAILFVPATLNPVAGFNPANGHLSGAGYGGDGVLANSSTSQFSYPVGMAYDSNGNLFIADASNHVVRRIDAITGDLSTFAGQQGNPGFYPLPGGSAPAASAQFNLLSGLVVDSSDNIYVADRTNEVVWKITSGGTVSIFAGDGTGSCGGAQTDTLGDGCPAFDATFDNPWALGIDSSNNIYIADSYNDLVREVSSSTGNISIFAGVASDAGSFGDCNANLYSVGGPGPYLATQAHLCFPEGIAFDSNGNAYISSATRDIVQMVNPQGQISTFAGQPGVRSSTGDGGSALAATLNEPAGVYVDAANRVYISDFFGGEIRMVDSTGNINDVMGNLHGSLNNYSIGEPDTEAIYNSSTGQYSGAADGIYSILMDPNGNIFADDSSGDAVTSAGTTGAYYFGNQQIYQTVTTTSLNAGSSFYPPYVTISNPSNVTLNFSGAPTVSTLTPSPAPNVFAITGGTCDFTSSLTPGSSCTVIVSFTPATDSAYTGSIVIGSNSSTSPNVIQLSGAGTGTCSYSTSLTSPASTFTSPPNVTSATQPVTLTNTGVCPIAVPSASIVNNNPAGSSAFAVASNNCPATLDGGASCTYNISFTPAALTSYSAQMELSIAGYGNIYSNLNGNGITAPAISFSPASLIFPSTTDGATATAMSTVMTNIGNAALTGVAVTLAGSNPTYFAFSGTNSCGTSLAAGASCTISVDFTPQAALTNYSAAISVADNAAGTPQTVALTGTGAAGLPPVVINDSETIHTSNAPGVQTPVLVLDNETIHTTDAPSLAPSILVLDSETIHTTDTPAATSNQLISPTITWSTPGQITYGTALSAAQLDASSPIAGSFSYNPPAGTVLTSGNQTLQATFTPQNASLYQSANASVTLTVTKANVQVSLTSSAASVSDGSSVTLTSTVTSTTTGTPTGTVTFYQGTTSLGNAQMMNGAATLDTTQLANGSDTVTASYSGDTNFNSGVSAGLAEAVTTFSLSLSEQNLQVLSGSQVMLTVTATPVGGAFSSPIQFSVSGLPTGVTASFAPSSITPGSAPASSALTIQASAMSAANSSGFGIAGRVAFGLLVPLLFVRRVRRRIPGLALLAVFAMALALSGCGAAPQVQTSQASTVTVTATSGKDVQTTTFQLTVN